MHAITSPPSVTASDRLGLTLFVAIVAHALVILGVTFVPHERNRQRQDTLDVVLVQSRAEAPPDDARYLAQASQDGGGESAQPERPATPLLPAFTGTRAEIASVSPPVPPQPLEAVDRRQTAAPKRSADTPERSRPERGPVLAQDHIPRPQKATKEPERPPDPRSQPDATRKNVTLAEVKAVAPVEQAPKQPTPTQTLTAASLRAQAIESLAAEIDTRLKAYAEWPRRKWITARTREHKYAAYMEAWRQKVERVGNLNYPDQARRKRLSGTLLLDVALNPDGSINEIILRRSSGKKVLDDAAVRIVKLSAPFAKFPDAFLEEVDILHIERTWQFLVGNKFESR